MDHAPLLQRHLPGRTRSMSRRDIVLRAMKLTSGAALALLPAQRWAGSVAAQDHEGVILIAGSGAEVSASPGSASARSAVAEAVAERGAARVQAAAALASADSDGGAIAQSPVATAFADPDQGAVAQSSVAVASAASEDDEAGARMMQPAPTQAGGGGTGGGGNCGGGNGGGRASGGRAARGGGGTGGRQIRGGGGGGGGRRGAAGGGGRGGRDRAGRGGGRDRVAELPVAGSGIINSGAVKSLLAAASALAGIGAVVLRGHGGVGPEETSSTVE